MTDFISEEELAEKVKSWAKSYAFPVLTVVIIGIAGVIGFRYYQDYVEEKSQDAADLYYEFLTARGLEESTESHLERLNADHKKSAYRVFALLYQAHDAVEKSDWDAAIAHYETGLSISRDWAIQDAVRIRMARLEIQLGRYDDALATLVNVKGSGHTSLVQELTGDIYIAQGELEAARKAYQSAIDNAIEDRPSEALRLKLSSVNANST